MFKRKCCVISTIQKEIINRSRRYLQKILILLGSALLLTACSGESSNEIAQEQPLDLSLQQCEVAQGGIVGTAIDPIMVGGVETQACLLDQDFGQSGYIKLKDSHQYEPLAWVLDGVYEIGQSKSYATLAELQADNVVEVIGRRVRVYAREGSVVVVHRNAKLSLDIESIDDNRSGGGEWGGVVVNSVGFHPDCGDSTSSENFCNINGPWGYFGGLSQIDTRYGSSVLTNTDINGFQFFSGFSGYVAEAGGHTKNNPPLSAAITINAPHFAQTISPHGILYSANTGLELNGGALSAQIYAIGNQGHAVHWHSGFAGLIGGNRIIYHDSDKVALKGEANSPAIQEEAGVQIFQLTVVDKSLTAGTALELSGGGDVSLEHFIVQGFNTCLSIADQATEVVLSNSVLYCDKVSQAQEGVPDYAETLLSLAENVYSLNPDLKSDLTLDNTAIQGVINATLPATSSLGVLLNYDFRLLYEPCFGVGTPLDETVDIGQNTYSICELQGHINSNLYFDDDINDKYVAWRLKGPLTFGSTLAGLSGEEQVAQLQQLNKVILDGDSKLLLDVTSSLTFNADVALSVRGTADNPVELASQDAEEYWAGVTINGLDNLCTSEEACALAAKPQVSINYLRLLNAGNGQPALKLHHVAAGVELNYLDITDSQTNGLVLDGGAANIDWLLVSNVVGDSVTWVNGYRGTVQYAILQPGEMSNGHALLGRNHPANHNASPRSRPVMANITVKGTDSSSTAILLEQGSGLLLYNSVVADFTTCLDIDDQATSDLQFSDPLEIYFDNVVLDCGSTIPDEDEDGGLDFATATQGLSGVYEVAAVLDSNFVATGGDVPGIGSWIDLSLAGDDARYLNADVGYMGSVLDSMDDWYLGWSDSVGVLLAAECDYKGVLEDDYVFRNEKAGSVNVGGSSVYSYFKVCGLRGTINEDFILNAFTSTDREALESGRQVNEEVYPGYFLKRDPAPTLWLINGLVRIGEGHLEITDISQVEAMKANPVTLGIEASSIVMVSKGGGLHITRGGALEVIGDVSLRNTELDGDAAGPVNLVGLIDNDIASFTAGYPLNMKVGTWAGLIIDGFSRNNQCPEAMADPGSRICNIPGEYGYHGGYDDNHSNVNIENLHLLQGSLRLNSVGRGKIENLYFGLGDLSGIPLTSETWGIENFGRAAIDIDGGVVNLRNVQIASGVPGNSLRWNHGYRGTMQSLYILDGGFTDSFSFSQEEFVSNLFQKSGVWYDYPTISGRNGDPEALPRSMPTLSNVSLSRSDLVMFFDPAGPSVTTTALELLSGSGLFLHNSIIGAGKADFDWLDWFGVTTIVDQCISSGDEITPLLGESVIFDQVAFACSEMSKNSNLANQIDNVFSVQSVSNQIGIVSNSSTIPTPSQANSDIYFFDWVFGQESEEKFNQISGVNSFVEWSRRYPTTNLINLGKAEPDYSPSESVDVDFIKNSLFFGSSDYFIPINTGEELRGED
ncbi:hypothetical protein [Microbulbifer sp. GL-2]|uniref:hypothetical protein n=1 Tax=Microbulbifer sp. GL-2 TaxID=2591606 RepID=UPI00117CFEF6|nr:hypothetical protein [Microbulbifer sp. GL-2]